MPSQNATLSAILSQVPYLVEAIVAAGEETVLVERAKFDIVDGLVLGIVSEWYFQQLALLVQVLSYIPDANRGPGR